MYLNPRQNATKQNDKKLEDYIHMVVQKVRRNNVNKAERIINLSNTETTGKGQMRKLERRSSNVCGS